MHRREPPQIDSEWSPTAVGRICVRVDSLNNPSAEAEVRRETPLAEANLVSSLRTDGLHSPALDIDSPVRVVAASTAGHHHLYLERPVTWKTYRRLLRALRDAGYIEDAVYWRSLDRGATFLRLPWVRKTEDEAAHGHQDAARDQNAADKAMRRIRRRVRAKLVLWWLLRR